MLKKLRLKFILINMTIVTVMLVAIFGLLYYSTSRNLERESMQMMKNIAMSPIKQGPPGPKHNDIHLPYFRVMIDNGANVKETEGGFFDLTDKEQIAAIVKQALDSESERGILKEYNLRFLRANNPMGSCLVFMDMTNEQRTLNNLSRTVIFTGILAFLIFLGISIVLAGWAVRPVEKAWQQQKQFAADASHELKTPLTVILTDVELMRADDCPEDDREKLSKSIMTMALQMRGLVESLLSIARIDNADYTAEKFETVCFSNIVSDTIMTFEPVFFEKGLELRSDIQNNIRMKGNPEHLKQLLGILLDNAIKYSISGGDTIVRLSKNSKKSCLLEVSNKGEPISTEDQANIFKRFYRADKARTMNHSYGLGLSIAQSIVDEHHGKISVNCHSGYNRFCVEMDFVQESQA